MGVLIGGGRVSHTFSAPPSDETMRRTPKALEVGERARGLLLLCQVWWGLDFTRRRGGQKRLVFYLSNSPPSVQISGYRTPKTEIFTDIFAKIWNINVPQGRILCAVFTKFADFVPRFRIYKCAHSRLHFLRQLKRAAISCRDMLRFYVAVISPVMEYTAPVWHTGLTAELMECLKTVQTRT